MSRPLPDVLLPVTMPMSWLYRQVIALRNARFDRGIGVGRIKVPVVSVGNLTTGGVGKTPTVMWIASQLLARDRRPAVAMRGYGATADEPADEVLEYQNELPAVPVVANPDRLGASRELLQQHPEIDCLLLDDGFQHRRVARDLDLVLIDASRQTFRDALLPAGHLREPPRALARADAVIVCRANELDQSLAEKIERYHGKPPIAWSRHIWRALHRYEPGETIDRTEPIETEPSWLRDKRIVTLLGIGHPQAVLDHIDNLGGRVVANIPAADHERFTRAQFELATSLCEQADALLMTRKDWVKARAILDLSDWPCPIVVPQLSIDVFAGRDALERVVWTALTSNKTDVTGDD